MQRRVSNGFPFLVRKIYNAYNEKILISAKACVCKHTEVQKPAFASTLTSSFLKLERTESYQIRLDEIDPSDN